jgi:hypothetical protein
MGMGTPVRARQEPSQLRHLLSHKPLPCMLICRPGAGDCIVDRSWINALECQGISAHGALPCRVCQIQELPYTQKQTIFCSA